MNNIKYSVNIDPSNKKEVYFDEDYIEFDLPKRKVDLSSFKVFFDAEIDPVTLFNDGSYLKRFLPRLSQSIIQELVITNNGTVIQSIKEFGLLYNILNDAIRENDEIYSNKPDTLTVNLIDSNNVATVRTDFTDNTTANVINPLKYRFFIQDFIGLINESNRPIIDCNKNNIKIKIVLAPKFSTYRGLRINMANAVTTNFDTNYRYRLKNITATIDILPNNTPSGGKTSFKNYKHIASDMLTDKNISLKYSHKGNLSYVLGTFTDAVRETDTGLQLHYCNTGGNFGTNIIQSYTAFNELNTFLSSTLNVKDILNRNPPNSLNNSIYFKRNGLNVKNCQFVLNGQAMTPFLDMTELFVSAREFFNNQLKRVKSIVNYQSEFFVHPIQINITDKDFISEIEWVVNADANTPMGGVAHLFVCWDAEVDF